LVLNLSSQLGRLDAERFLQFFGPLATVRFLLRILSLLLPGDGRSLRLLYGMGLAGTGFDPMRAWSRGGTTSSSWTNSGEYSGPAAAWSIGSTG